MSSVPPPPSQPEDEVNPYAAPESDPEPVEPDLPPDSTEAIRRAHLNHEASVKAVGTLYLLSAVLLGFSGVVVLANLRSLPAEIRTIQAASAVFNLVLAVVFGFVAHGLRRLLPWGRWLAVGVICTLLVLSLGNIAYIAMVNPAMAGFTAGVALVSALIPAYILYLLLSEKGRMVFSPQYKRVIAQTPHVKYRTSCIIWGFVAVLVALVVIGAITAVVGITQR